MIDCRTVLVFVMGPTCSGKSTFLHEAERFCPEEVGLVEVGKMLRAKYPPSYFKGQNNPKHTAQEAWELCEREVKARRDDGKRVILVDGQPRDVPQVELCLTRFPHTDYRVEFLLLDASFEERERRARATRKGEDLETLALPRLTNDMVAYYTVLVELMKWNWPVEVADTTNEEGVKASLLFKSILSKYILISRGQEIGQDLDEDKWDQSAKKEAY